MKTRLCRLAAGLFVAALLPTVAVAEVILQPAGVTTNVSAVTPADRVRNQSGLSVGYTSLVTDFDTYIAANPAHNSSLPANRFISNLTATTGNFDFDLGGSFTISSLALWNFGGNLTNNLRGFTLLADDDASFSSPTSLGTFDADPNTAPQAAVLPDVFAFTATSASFVRMQVTGVNGGSRIEFGEVAFRAVAPQGAVVPEPATLGLLLLAAPLLAAGVHRRRNKGAGKEIA